MEIVFATGNKDKLKQVELMLKDIVLKSPKDFGYENFEVDEDKDTLEGNAYKKAMTFYNLTKIPTFSDDTGLFVEALDNRPGVFAHRYAGENATYKDNRVKLLDELSGKENRKAYFKTVICFVDKNSKAHYFEGRLNGVITEREIGPYDFGYDQIFKPDNSNLTLGQMKASEINKISHRSKAIKNFVNFLEKEYIWKYS